MKTASYALVTFGLGWWAGAVQAQGALYGVLDAGVPAERGCGADCRDLWLAPGLRNGALFGRRAYVGLDSRLGALTLGRPATSRYPSLTDVADPFKGGMAGGAGNLLGYAAMRYDNAINYATPRRHGLIAGLIYSVGEAPGSGAANRAYGATLGYANGAVNLSLARQRKDSLIQGAGAVPGLDTGARNTLLAANFLFGGATAYLAYGHNRGAGAAPWEASNPYGALALSTPSSNSRDVLLGLSVPRGAGTYMVSFIHKDDHDAANRDASQFALGMTYALSRRTDFYASYARIRNRNGAAYTVGNAGEPGRGGDRAFNIGLRHGF